MTDAAHKRPVVWITRTQPAAAESAKAWQAVGANTIVLPLLAVEGVAHSGRLRDRTTLVFTSKNGVDHFQPGDRDKASHIVCVGNATAEHARAAGYENVTSVDGTSEDVTAFLRKHQPQHLPVRHVSGQHVRGRIVEDLTEAGFSASRRIVYRSKPVLRLPERAPTHVALYSPLAAETFARLETPLACTTLSISPATDAALAGLSGLERRIATRPTEAAMLALLQGAGEG
jgi:uroporphyrinogen-III synthase